MSKILITADWHVKRGLQAQLIVDYLDYLQEYYFENDFDWLFVLGDVFHKSSNIKNDAFVPLFMKLLEMKNNGVHFVFVVGNHDVYNVDYDTVVDTFSPIGRVIKEYTRLEFNGEILDFLPYTKNEEDIPDSGDYLFTHVPIANFTFDNAFHATEKHAFPFEKFEDFNMVFTGHFHRHQHIKNIVYTGSPNQQYRGEVGQEKGFITFDTDTEKWEFVEYDEAPVYIEIGSSDIKNLKHLDIKGNFVVVYIDEKIQDFAKLKYVLYEYGAVEIIPVFLKEEDDIQVEEFADNKDIEDIAREFISSIEDVDNEKLLQTFEKVLGEA
jgi:DNA repair exonuclease SbcCD nuclease subunit